MYIIPIILLLALVYTIYNKIKYTKLRNNSKKIKATIFEYRKEKGPFRNDFTLLNYPYVKIDLDNNEYIIQKLSYADNYSSPFMIGEQVYVFWYEDKLLYWNAYDRGIYKYFPKKLLSWNED